NIRKAWMPEVRILHDHPDFSFVEPRFQLIVEQCRCVYGGLCFPASHGDSRIVDVAGNDLPLGAQQCVLRPRQINLRAGGGARGSDDCGALEVVERADWRRVPDHVDGYVCSRPSDVTEFCRVITDSVAAEHLLRGKVLHRDRNHRSVTRRNFREVVYGIEPTGTGHVRDEDFRSAGDETAKMIGCELAIERVCTSRTVPENDPNGLAGKTVRGSRTVRSKCNAGKGADHCASAPSEYPTLGGHGLPPSATRPSVFDRL